MSAIEIGHGQTARRLCIYEFADRYGVPCSLQKSSLATEDAIWFGANGPAPGRADTPRMHLTQDHVRALLPLLTHFAETGELPAPRSGP